MKTTPPYPKCPYKLGLVQTFANPCPQCKLNNYKAYETFKSQTGHYSLKQDKDEQH